ncbi:MAG: dephospho-CoA kinase [Verrucomicrobia bacterium]|nr:dephospho-CoA kinase [Verrucomicrobiota bacterium]
MSAFGAICFFFPFNLEIFAMTLGLTGGIGCGKSSVLPAFEKLGFAVIDTDKIASALHAEPATRRFVRERFGESALAADGSLNKTELAKIVFSDKASLADLEAFMHPKIRETWKNLTKNAARGENFVVEVPLLFEKNYEGDFDATVCVAASEQIQLARLEKRGLPPEQARERMAAQLPLSDKVRRADFVIFNDGSREFLEAQVQECVKFFTH